MNSGVSLSIDVYGWDFPPVINKGKLAGFTVCIQLSVPDSPESAPPRVVLIIELTAIMALNETFEKLAWVCLKSIKGFVESRLSLTSKLSC